MSGNRVLLTDPPRARATAAVAALVPVTEAPVVVMMTEAEARDRVDQINGHSGHIRALLLELYEREGWKAMHYGSWRECALSEFDLSQSRLYKLLDAARVDRNISNIVGKPRPEKHGICRLGGSLSTAIPDRQLLPLTNLDPEKQREVWKEAIDTAPDGKVTSKHVEEVKERLADQNDRVRLTKIASQLCTPTRFFANG